MAVLVTRRVAVPAWIIAFAFVVLFATPLGMVAKMLLLVAGGLVVTAAVLFRGKCGAFRRRPLCNWAHSRARDRRQSLSNEPAFPDTWGVRLCTLRQAPAVLYSP